VIIDYSRLFNLASIKRPEFLAAHPFPHVILDDFLEQPVLKLIEAAFPSPDSKVWKEPSNTHTQFKRVLRGGPRGLKELNLPELARRVFFELNSSPFLHFLSELTGLRSIIGDPYLAEAGFHLSGNGGYLDIHADFSHHDVLGLERRLNMIIFLNSSWQKSYGGELCLYDRDLNPIQEISPIANRCVVFATSDFSFHGHPKPMSLPEGVFRKSIAMYYYSVPLPDRRKVAIHFPEDPTFWHMPLETGDGEDRVV